MALLLPAALKQLAYAEGNAEIERSSLLVASVGSIQWAPSSSVKNCAVLEAGATRAEILVQLPADATEMRQQELCVLYTVRSDKAQNWWFVAPPPAEQQQRACVPAPAVPTSNTWVRATIKLDGLELPSGYTRLNVVLEQPRHSTTPLVPSLGAVVAVQPRDSLRPAWLSPAASLLRARHLGDDTARSLRESYRIVREDERAEKLDYQQRTAAGRARYSPLFDWRQPASAQTGSRQPLASQSAALTALHSVLAPELLAALATPTPDALWRLVRAPDAAHHPVYTIRLLSDHGASRLTAELTHAHASNLTARPTNNVSDGLRESALPPSEQGVPVAPGTGAETGADSAGQTPSVQEREAGAQTVVRDGPASLLLDEVGLDGVAHALAGAVLAPLARLLFPEWTDGGRLDSYHAFSIHRRSHAADQTAWFRPSSNSEGGSEGGSEGSSHADGADTPTQTKAPTPDGATRVAAQRTGVHSDVWYAASFRVASRTLIEPVHCPIQMRTAITTSMRRCRSSL